MGNDCLKILIELEKVIQDQTIDNYARDKAIRELVKQAVDISRYGFWTTNDLKKIVDSSLDAKIAFAQIAEYLCTHDLSK